MSEQEVFDALTYRIEVNEYGTRRYYNAAGQLHRLDGPAVIHQYGLMFWYQNGYRHRTDGAAIEWASGTKEWYQNGQLHRTDGAAVEWSNGDKEWWLNGQPVTEAEFNQKVNQNV